MWRAEVDAWCLPFSLEPGLLIESGAHQLTGCSTLRSTCLHPWRARVRGQAFTWVLGIWLGTSCLHGRYFINWASFPVPVETLLLIGWLIFINIQSNRLHYHCFIYRYHCNLLHPVTISYLLHYVGLISFPQTVPVVFSYHIYVCSWWYVVKSLCHVTIACGIYLSFPYIILSWSLFLHTLDLFLQHSFYSAWLVEFVLYFKYRIIPYTNRDNLTSFFPTCMPFISSSGLIAVANSSITPKKRRHFWFSINATNSSLLGYIWLMLAIDFLS